MTRGGFSRLAETALVLMFWVGMACASPRGGWDVAALVVKNPRLSEIAGQRLGDMLPFPALDGDRIVLVACRFASPESVRVHVRGSQWPTRWGAAGLDAMDRSLSGLGLEFAAEARSIEGAISEIKIVMIEAVGGEGPKGLADTLSECDVTPKDSPIDRTARTAGAESRGDVRGELIGAEIRMRRAQRNAKGLVRDATAEEWVGALMHEVGHALGFAGHVAVGDSILVRDESRIRAAGRRALAGQSIRVQTLEALYAIAPGTRLGTRELSTDDVHLLHKIKALIREREIAGWAPMTIYSSVGDHEARLVWRDSQGRQLGVRFPHWRQELRSGAVITLRPDRATRQRLASAAAEPE